MTTLAQTAAGTKIYIGGSNPTGDPSDLAAEVSWTEIGEVTNIPEFGAEFEKIIHKPLGNRSTFKFKGGKDSGDITLDMARAPTDAGQAACLAALEDDGGYNFKIEFNDQPAGASANPTTIKFAGKVGAFKTVVGQTNSIIGAKLAIWIDGDLEEEPAATS